MSEYILVYRNSDEAHRETMGSPERAQQSMRKWQAWLKGVTDNGQLVSVGQPLERVGCVVSGKKKTVTDGPYAEVKDVVGGFSIIEAKNLDDATQIASGCPILESGGSVEVRPVMQFDM